MGWGIIVENGFLLAQIIGFFAFLISTLKYQLKCPRKVLWTECPASALWIIHVLLLGGIQAAIVNSIAIIRAILCLTLPSKYTPYFLGTALLLAIIIVVPTVKEIYQILPLFGFGLYGLSCLFLQNPVKLRVSCLGGDSAWLIYALMIYSPPLAITCALSIISSLIALYRYEREWLKSLVSIANYRTYP